MESDLLGMLHFLYQVRNTIDVLDFSEQIVQDNDLFRVEDIKLYFNNF